MVSIESPRAVKRCACGGDREQAAHEEIELILTTDTQENWFAETGADAIVCLAHVVALMRRVGRVDHNGAIVGDELTRTRLQRDKLVRRRTCGSLNFIVLPPTWLTWKRGKGRERHTHDPNSAFFGPLLGGAHTVPPHTARCFNLASDFSCALTNTAKVFAKSLTR